MDNQQRSGPSTYGARLARPFCQAYSLVLVSGTDRIKFSTAAARRLLDRKAVMHEKLNRDAAPFDAIASFSSFSLCAFEALHLRC